ncbi:NADH-quinone oxidoreductase subunit C [Janibacter cremeus]|uniref:NADH-quinone oxidoreductase subunit C n=1 Tax=Janibacter cremeus TaxID=1285192 RepID=A0A852VL01_9MICO|nr:NADH-quinone oxidoreductase subunit C [Janibacter cremeus]NYF97757.1 NADH-quinone oxidoreductase subunit C [Janibacter cremeus]
MTEENKPEETQGKDVAASAKDVDAPRPKGVHPQGPGLGGTAHEDYPSTEGLAGDQRPVEYTNVGGSPERGKFDPEQVPAVRGQRQGMFGVREGGSDTSGYGGLQAPIAFPGAAERPYGNWFDAAVDTLAEVTGSDLVERVVVHADELTLHVAREDIVPVMRALRDQSDLRFEMCMSVSGVHFLEDTGRELHVAYHLLSITHSGRRLRVEVTAPDADPHIPSIVEVYPAADWHERETWDMFGVIFDGHPALTRILMPDDWAGHPQRKDYPLGGIPVEYKGGTVPPPDERRAYN